MKRVFIALGLLFSLSCLGYLFLWNLYLLPQQQLAAKEIDFPTPTPVILSAEKLTTLINEWRVSQGFQPYIEDQRLCAIASDRTDDGADEHEGLYEKYSDYPFVIQENMAHFVFSEESTLKGWLDSPPHRATLEKQYAYSCIATNGDTAIQIFSNF